jgi:hypothetical protein
MVEMTQGPPALFASGAFGSAIRTTANMRTSDP